MDIARTGNTAYAAIKGDAIAIAGVRREFASLSYSLLTDANAGARITSATINGQSFSASQSITQLQRLDLLRWVVACIDNCGPVSTSQIVVF